MRKKFLNVLPLFLMLFFLGFFLISIFGKITLAQSPSFNLYGNRNISGAYSSFNGDGKNSCCSSFSASGGGGSLGSGCCGGSISSGKRDLKALEKEAISFYRRKYNSTSANLKAQVNDYGCHVEIVILEKGKKLASLAYRNGQFFELPY